MNNMMCHISNLKQLLQFVRCIFEQHLGEYKYRIRLKGQEIEIKKLDPGVSNWVAILEMKESWFIEGTEGQDVSASAALNLILF